MEKHQLLAGCAAKFISQPGSLAIVIDYRVVEIGRGEGVVLNSHSFATTRTPRKLGVTNGLNVT